MCRILIPSLFEDDVVPDLKVEAIKAGSGRTWGGLTVT